MTQPTPLQLVVDGKPQPFSTGDSVLVAMLRNEAHPTGGGTLCCGGDCPHCLATVDGIAYVRTCQVAAKPGMVIAREHFGGEHPLLSDTDAPINRSVPARNLFCDVVVIGQGESGRAEAAAATAAGKSVITVDTQLGEEAIAIYAGPRVVVRTDQEMLVMQPREEVVVATGAAEIPPIAPGSDLMGLLTSRAAEHLAQAGIDLGTVVAVGTPPADIDATPVSGDIVRFEGSDGQVTAVVMADADGNETTHPCNTVALGLGMHPRNALYLMGHDLPVRVVGEAAGETELPKCPGNGIVCPCIGASIADLEYTWESGFREMELIKRSTLAGTGTCQGMSCLPYLQSYILDKGKELQPRFTARPMNRQPTIGEIAAGAYHRITLRTALDEEHRKLGAQMERSGPWWRPWSYGDVISEYWAVRTGVSIMDVSTLGKIVVSGPDALEFLERLYPAKVSSIRTGRARYVLNLNERGYVLDDGLIAKESDTRYALTFTSSGSTHSEMWLRDWAHGWGMDVRIMNQTRSLGAINVTGPQAAVLLERAGLEKMPRFMRFIDTQVAGIDCRVYRLSFTGEVSVELHHHHQDSVALWRTLLELGEDLGIRPHGLDALTKLRLEKGHIIVGQDTDFDSTVRRIDHEWAVKMEKEEFLGRPAVVRTDKVPLDKMLVGLEMEEDSAFEGAVIYYGETFAGAVTSYTWSPILNKAVMLGWVDFYDGVLPTEVTINGHTARRVELPFYDKEGGRAKA